MTQATYGAELNGEQRKKYGCKHCDQRFDHPSQVGQHARANHADVYQPLKSRDVTRRTFSALDKILEHKRAIRTLMGDLEQERNLLVERLTLRDNTLDNYRKFTQVN